MAVDIVMPQMGESIFEGTITKWLKKPGDKVERDEPLFEISTDKVDAEIPSPSAGVLKEIKVGEGKTVPIQTVVGVIDAAGDGAGAAKSAAPAQAPAPTPAPKAAEPATFTNSRRLLDGASDMVSSWRPIVAQRTAKTGQNPLTLAVKYSISGEVGNEAPPPNLLSLRRHRR